jgi:hypothetical protein
MQAFRTVMALGLGLSLMVLSLTLLAPSPAPLAQSLASAWTQASSQSGRLAEVAIAFDGRGHPLTQALRRSSGSVQTDEAAVREALELASLRQPGELAGKTLTFTARFE